MITRRHFIRISAAGSVFATALPALAQDAVEFDATVTRPDADPMANNPWGLNPR